MASINRTDYEGLINWLIAQRELLNNESYQLITTNAFRNLIFDLKPIYTGYASKAAIEAHNGCTSKMTAEHFNPRQRMAEKIVAGVKSGASKEELLKTLVEACKIHYVTKRENDSLRPHQKLEDYVPEKAYALLGIELVEHVITETQKYVYNIEGVVYNEIKPVLEKYNINYNTLIQRCNAKKKWSEWQKIPRENA